MNNTIKLIVAGVAVLVVGFILGSLGGYRTATPIATPVAGVTYDSSRLVGDVYQGLSGTLVMSNGSVVGPITGAITTNSQAKFDAGILYSSTFATTSTGAGTLTAANITGIDTILSTNAGALTLTLPASTTLSSFVPLVGDARRILLVNQGTTLLTMAGGTGTLLQTASTTKTVNIGGSAALNCVRKTNTDVVCLMVPGI